MRPSTYNPTVIPDNYHGFPIEHFGISDLDAQHLDDVMLTRGQIKDRLQVVARELWNAWDGKPMVVLCVLNGAARFFEMFVRCLNKMNIQSEVKKPFIIKYFKTVNYQGTCQIKGGGSCLPESLKASIVDKHFLVVEDIVDTGDSIVRLLDSLNDINVLSKKTLTMVTKRTKRSNGYVPDFCCFEIPDKWVVGFGFDVDDHYRHYDHVCTMSQEGIKKFSS